MARTAGIRWATPRRVNQMIPLLIAGIALAEHALSLAIGFKSTLAIGLVSLIVIAPLSYMGATVAGLARRSLTSTQALTVAGDRPRLGPLIEGAVGLAATLVWQSSIPRG